MRFDGLELIQSRNLQALKQNIERTLMAPFQLIGILKELAGRIGGLVGTEEAAESGRARSIHRRSDRYFWYGLSDTACRKGTGIMDRRILNEYF